MELAVGTYAFSPQFKSKLVALMGDVGPDDSQFVELRLWLMESDVTKATKATVWCVGGNRFHVLTENGPVQPAILHESRSQLEIITESKE